MTDIGTDYIELGVILAQAYQSYRVTATVDPLIRQQIADTSKQLILCSRRLFDLAEVEERRRLTPAEEQKREAVQAQVHKLLSPFGIDPILDSELKLMLPSGETNDAAGTGWMVPR